MNRDATTRYLETEVRCMHCGVLAGQLRRRDAPGVPSVFRRHSGTAVAIRNLSGHRCGHCTGPLYADELEVRSIVREDLVPFERPRRGRPPKWLVEMRRAQEAAEQAS